MEERVPASSVNEENEEELNKAYDSEAFEEEDNRVVEEPVRYVSRNGRKTQSTAKSNKSDCLSAKMAEIVKKKATVRSLRADDANNANFQKTLENHRRRIRTAKSTIDTSPPVGCFSFRNASYRQRLNEYSRIDRENAIMLRHLAEIIHGKGSIDNKPNKNLTLYKNQLCQERQMKLLRITLDNLSLLKRIQSTKPFYSRKEQLADYAHHEEVMAALSYYPLFWQMNEECQYGPNEVRARENAVTNPRPLCFLSLGNAEEYFGKIVVELYADDCPMTAENFRGLCTGEYGLSYKCSTIHRIIQDILWQGGDISGAMANGKASIFGGTFKDENFKHKHKKAGTLSMANVGPNTNGSQFIITAKPLPVLDSTNVVFGEVKSGLNVLQKLFKAATPSGKSKKKIFIVDCGEGNGGDEQGNEDEGEYNDEDKSVSEPTTYATDEDEGNVRK